MYAIAGVTGRTGAVVAKSLLERGKKVRVIVRDAAKGADWAARGAEVAVADLGDERALTAAFAGVEGAYVLLPPNGAVSDFRAYQDATSAAITAAVRAAKVPHVVLLSSIGAELPSGTGPIAGLHVFESRLRAVPGLASTFLRAGYFVENLGASLGALEQGVLPSFLPASQPMDMVATRDIGELAATLLVEGAKETRAVNLGGPSRTMNDVARALTGIVGREIKVAESPLSAVVPAFTSFGFTPDLAALYGEMLAGFAAGQITWESGTRTVQGKTPIESVLREALSGGR